MGFKKACKNWVKATGVSEQVDPDLSFQVLQMRLAGSSIGEISREFSLTTEETSRIFKESVENFSSGREEEVISLELDRLNSLQKAVYSNAMEGDYKAIDTVLSIMDKRLKLIGLNYSIDKSERELQLKEQQALLAANPAAHAPMEAKVGQEVLMRMVGSALSKEQINKLQKGDVVDV